MEGGEEGRGGREGGGREGGREGREREGRSIVNLHNYSCWTASRVSLIWECDTCFRNSQHVLAHSLLYMRRLTPDTVSHTILGMKCSTLHTYLTED